MRKTFLLTSILLLSACWALAQYSSGSSATDQSTSGSQNQTSTDQTSTDQATQGVNPGSSDSSQSEPSSSASEPQSTGGVTKSQSSSGESQDMGQSMSSQQGETSSDMSHGGTASAPMGGTTSGRMKTFQGCLSESNGKFHLTDKMGTSYELTGKTANLKGHVGHTIAITGKAMTSGAGQPGAMSGEQAGMEQTIHVSSFRHVSSNCKSSSSGSSTGGSSNY